MTNNSDFDAIRKEIVNDILAVKGNHEVEKIDAIRDKIASYPEYLNPLYDVFTIILLFDYERNFNDYDSAEHLTFHLNRRLTSKEKWDLEDIRMASRVFGYTVIYEEIAERIFNELASCKDERLDEKLIFGIKVNTHLLVLSRLMRDKFFMYKKLDKMDDYEISLVEDINETFNYHYNEIMRLYEGTNKVKTHKFGAMIRKGIIFQDEKLINEGLRLLKEAGQTDVYDIFKQEIADYSLTGDFEEARKWYYLRSLGRKLRAERKAVGLNMETAARYIRIEPETLKNIECGKAEIEVYHLLRLREMLKKRLKETDGSSKNEMYKTEDFRLLLD
ncbi:MAG: hypothetical protein FWE33_07705 [Defluviitaleaceae bacterium]|nr:hypothetical protein [Defluviitaleaceae bacterium]